MPSASSIAETMRLPPSKWPRDRRRVRIYVEEDEVSAPGGALGFAAETADLLAALRPEFRDERPGQPAALSLPKLRRSVSPFGDPPRAAEIRSHDQSAALASRTATLIAFCATRRASSALSMSSSIVVAMT